LKRLLLSGAVTVALFNATAAFAAANTAATARLVRVTSPVARGHRATLVARVAPVLRCSITVYYKNGPAHLKPKPLVGGGLVSWTWVVGKNTTPGRWPIKVACGSSGSFRTHFRVVP
jgi:hypothetical protein